MRNIKFDDASKSYYELFENGSRKYLGNLEKNYALSDNKIEEGHFKLIPGTVDRYINFEGRYFTYGCESEAKLSIKYHTSPLPCWDGNYKDLVIVKMSNERVKINYSRYYLRDLYQQVFSKEIEEERERIGREFYNEKLNVWDLDFEETWKQIENSNFYMSSYLRVKYKNPITNYEELFCGVDAKSVIKLLDDHEEIIPEHKYDTAEKDGYKPLKDETVAEIRVVYPKGRFIYPGKYGVDCAFDPIMYNRRVMKQKLSTALNEYNTLFDSRFGSPQMLNWFYHYAKELWGYEPEVKSEWTINNLVGEEWRRLKDADHIFVSNFGRVATIQFRGVKGRTRLLKPFYCNGYATTQYENNRGRLIKIGIGRLVAKTFIPNPDNKPECDHINTVRDDNRVWNLHWVSHDENMNNPITVERRKERMYVPVLQYDLQGNFIKEFPAVKIAEDELGITGISNCCQGKLKTAGGFVWRYKYKK